MTDSDDPALAALRAEAYRIAWDAAPKVDFQKHFDAIVAAAQRFADARRVEHETWLEDCATHLADVPGFFLLAMHDPAGRRGLWARWPTRERESTSLDFDLYPQTVEIRAGREGNDARVTLRVGQTLDDRALYDLFQCLSHALGAAVDGITARHYLAAVRERDEARAALAKATEIKRSAC